MVDDDDSELVAPSRVLYTSTRGARRAPGLVVASSLRQARALLESEGHHDIRFWSHPVFGDARGRDPRDAYARAPKPATWWSNLAIVALAVGLVGSTDLLFLVAVPSFPVTLPVELIIFSIFALLPGLAALLRDVELKRYQRARIILWLVRLSFPCGMLLAPALELWGVRIRAGRRGVDAALRPYAWMPWVGLAGVRGSFAANAVREAGRIHEHFEALRQTVRPGSDDELQLVLDELEWRAVRGTEDEPRPDLRERLERRCASRAAVPPFAPLAWALLAVEARDPRSAEAVAGAFRVLALASQGLFAFHSRGGHLARANARCDRIEGAEQALVEHIALLQVDEALFDAAAREIALARRRRVEREASRSDSDVAAHARS